MIELVLSKRCIECDKCVQVCPTDVFDAVPGAPPVIARQTCFMCELYCPVDALYVDPDCRQPVDTRESEIASPRPIGLSNTAATPAGAARRTHPNESWRMNEIFAAARDILQEDTR